MFNRRRSEMIGMVLPLAYFAAVVVIAALNKPREEDPLEQPFSDGFGFVDPVLTPRA